jgi:hypothetical protein
VIVCPNCGFQQDGGDKCVKCSTLFAYYAETASQITNGGTLYSPRVRDGKAAPGNAQEPAEEPIAFAGLRTFYRRARWVGLAFVVLLFVLILRKGAPPPVKVEPDAAARAEEKIRVSEAESSVGEPHQLQLDNVELNSYLNQNLAINGRAETASISSNASPAPASASGAAAPASPAAISESSPQSPPQTSPQAAPTLEEIQSSVKDVRVDMQGDLVKAYIVYNFHGQDLSLELDGHLHAEGGYLKFEPVSGSLGSLPLPQSVLQSAARQLLNSPENREKLRLPPDVTDIQIVDGHVVASYK